MKKNIKVNLKDKSYERADCVYDPRFANWLAFVVTIMNTGIPYKVPNFFFNLQTLSFSRTKTCSDRSALNVCNVGFSCYICLLDRINVMLEDSNILLQ
jgi:hypothetical protein